ALDGGINYIDTAVSYGEGRSESRIGQLMPTRRKEIFLATKIQDRTRDGFRRDLEASLKRLRVDQLDLLHIHSLGHDDDLRKIEAPDGALEGLYWAREQKLTRYIGITSHTDGKTLARALERHEFDCTQMALNPSLFNGFEEHALPVARKRNLGIIAMKVTAQEKLLGQGPGLADVDSLLRYDLSLPVATVSIGMPKMEFIRHNLEVARSFQPIGATEAQALREKLAPSRPALEGFWAHHVDGGGPLHV
ncbi:MAG: aldo/keto reductase, partial [Acidobacteriota bacterium]